MSTQLLAQLRQTLGRLEAALSSVEDALVLTDFQGQVEWTNRAFDRLVSRPRLQSLGKPLVDLLPENFVDGHPKTAFDLLARARNGSGRTNWDLAPGSPRHVLEVSWSPVNIHPDPSLVFVFRDLSAITRIQDELTASRNTLEKQVASRTLELRKARDQAIAATGEMSDFLSTISHEIRTPLNAVIGMTEILIDSDLTPQQQELAVTIHSSGELLLRLVNDILDLSKMEAKKLAIRSESFSIRAILEETARILDASIKAKGLSFQMQIADDLPDDLHGDSLRLRQILLNLMNNAIKFTDEGFVQVDVTWNPDSQHRICLMLVVSDSGRGVSPEFLPRLFRSFSQEKGLPHDSNQSQGTGLGLAICDRLCQLLGGSIQAESELGKGSRFSVKLPFKYHSASPERANNPLPSMGGDGFAPLKILVAEDNRINQRVIELLLKKLNQEPEFVSNGQDAVNRVLQGGIDIVFMDLQMPVLDGLEATRLLRGSAIDQPYIVALTAFAFGDHQQECLDAGMNDFLNKPVRLQELISTLHRFQQSHHDRLHPMPLNAETRP